MSYSYVGPGSFDRDDTIIEDIADKVRRDTFEAEEEPEGDSVEEGVDDFVYIDKPNGNEYNFEEPDIYSYKNESNLQLRTVPFGPPKIRDNTSHNPGRHVFAPKNSSNSYATREGRNFFVLDEGTVYNKSSKWRSGPSDNNRERDHVMMNAGYWTAPGGTNCWWGNDEEQPHMMTSFQVYNRESGAFLFDLGTR